MKKLRESFTQREELPILLMKWKNMLKAIKGG